MIDYGDTAQLASARLSSSLGEETSTIQRVEGHDKVKGRAARNILPRVSTWPVV
jgi:hypothetical protein